MVRLFFLDDVLEKISIRIVLKFTRFALQIISVFVRNGIFTRSVPLPICERVYTSVRIILRESHIEFFPLESYKYVEFVRCRI